VQSLIIKSTVRSLYPGARRTEQESDKKGGPLRGFPFSYGFGVAVDKGEGEWTVL